MGINKFYLSLLLIFSLSLVSSLQFTQNQNVNLTIPCSFNGTNCDSTAVCNVSVSYPNTSLLINNQLMSNNGNGLPTISVPDTSVLGTYPVSSTCTQSGISGSSSFEYEITQTGTTLSTGQGLLYFLFLLASLVITGFTLFFAIRLPFKNTRNEEGIMISINDLKYLKIFLSVMSYIMIMWVLGILRSITSNFLILPGPALFFEWAYWIMLSILWPLIVCSIIFSFVLFINDKKLNRILERGLPI